MKKEPATNIGDVLAFEVIVGNVGRVHEGNHENLARQIFNNYVTLSKQGYGRVAYESVTLFKEGEPIKEYHGKQDKDEH